MGNRTGWDRTWFATILAAGLLCAPDGAAQEVAADATDTSGLTTIEAQRAVDNAAGEARQRAYRTGGMAGWIATDPSRDPIQLAARRYVSDPDADPSQASAIIAALDNDPAIPVEVATASANQETATDTPLPEPSESTPGVSTAEPAEQGVEQTEYASNAPATSRATNDNTASTAATLVFVLLALAIYLLPTIIAFSRQHRFRFPIMAFNIGAGWSGIGWIWTLVWAVWPERSALVDPVVGDATGIERRP